MTLRFYYFFLPPDMTFLYVYTILDLPILFFADSILITVFSKL